jgi:hypothetical protein
MGNRPTPKHISKFNGIIFEEYNKVLFEIFNNSQETKCEIIKDNYYGGYNFDIYRFKTSSGNSYDVDFYETYVNSENITLMQDNDKLSNHINVQILNARVVGFTRTELERTDGDDLDDEIIKNNDKEYNKRTERNEQYEVLEKISFIIQEFNKNNPNINCYILGKDSDEKNILAYLKIFQNIFSNDFKMFDSNYYENRFGIGAYYFIKNTELK